jgi:hypothetical protein
MLPPRLLAPALLLALVLLGLTGCPAHIARPYPAPETGTLIGAVQQRNTAIATFRARTNMDHFDQEAGQRVKGEVFVLLSFPDRLHFHAVSPAGTPLATLTSNGDEFSLFDADKNRFLYGPADACNIGRLTGIQIDGPSIATILVGGMPLIQYVSSNDTWDDSRGVEVVTLNGEDGTVETLSLAGPENDWTLTDATITDPSGAVVLAVHNEHFHTVSGIDLPGKTKVEEPSRQADVIIEWESQEVNPTLPDAAWTQEPPPGVRPQEVHCGTDVNAPPPPPPPPSTAPSTTTGGVELLPATIPSMVPSSPPSTAPASVPASRP